jgi:hypothetical protein
VRRTVIQWLLPFVLCLLPLLVAALVAAATPAAARTFYLQRVSDSPIDWIILGLGLALFTAQLLLCWRALQWRGNGFDERPDGWLSHLAQAAEWFPMLGLIGTVTGILQTFSTIANDPAVTTKTIIGLYAPAITATGSGLAMALINILPTWVVVLGRDLILTLGGGTPSSGEPRS